MKLRLLRPWKYRKVGTILNDVPEGAANLLIRRNLAEPVKEEEKPSEQYTRSQRRAVRA